MAQLRQLGLTKDDVTYRIRVGRLHSIFRGVYAVGHPRVGQLGWFHAALLAIGPDAILSHRAAAAVWRFRRWDGGRVDITTSRRVGPREHLQLHSSLIAEKDHTRRHSLRLTTPARTLLDLAPTLTHDALAHLVGQAEHARLVSVPTLKKDLDRWGPRPERSSWPRSSPTATHPPAASWKSASSPSLTSTASPAPKSTPRS